MTRGPHHPVRKRTQSWLELVTVDESRVMRGLQGSGELVSL